MKFERNNENNNLRCFCGFSLIRPWITIDQKWYCTYCKKSWTDNQIFKLLSKKHKKRFKFWLGCHLPEYYIKKKNFERGEL